MLGTVGVHVGLRGWAPGQLVGRVAVADVLTAQNALACGQPQPLFAGTDHAGHYGCFVYCDGTVSTERPYMQPCLAFRGMEREDNEDEDDATHVCEMRALDVHGRPQRCVESATALTEPLFAFQPTTEPAVLLYSPHGLCETDSDGERARGVGAFEMLRVDLGTHATSGVALEPSCAAADIATFLDDWDADPYYVVLGRQPTTPGRYTVLLAAYTAGFDPDPCLPIGTFSLARA